MSLFKSWLIAASLFFCVASCAETVLQDIAGKKVSFSDLKGKWVFINYWASWCQPCMDEIPELNRFYEQHKDRDVALFSVNFNGSRFSGYEELIQALDIRYPVLKNDPADSLNLGDIRGVPVTFVFNPNGELSQTLYGGQTLRSLNKVLRG